MPHAAPREKPATMTEIRRALEAAQKAGLRVTGYEVDGSTVRVFTASGDDGAGDDGLKSLERKIAGLA